VQFTHKHANHQSNMQDKVSSRRVSPALYSVYVPTSSPESNVISRSSRSTF